jgi:hypothetical protein
MSAMSGTKWDCFALSGLRFVLLTASPRALPWAVMLLPLRGGCCSTTSTQASECCRDPLASLVSRLWLNYLKPVSLGLVFSLIECPPLGPDRAPAACRRRAARPRRPDRTEAPISRRRRRLREPAAAVPIDCERGTRFLAIIGNGEFQSKPEKKSRRGGLPSDRARVQAVGLWVAFRSEAS